MIKVVHIISDTNIGGAGRYLLTYLGECNRSRFDVTAIVPIGSKLEEPMKALGINVLTSEGIAEQSFNKSAVSTLRKLFRELRPDIVHSHAVLSARIAARLAGVKKIVYTRHSVFPPDKLLTKGPGRLMNSILNRWAADGIIAVAKAAMQNLLDTGVDDKKISVIYNGVAPLKELSEAEKDAVRHTLGVRDGAKVIAIAARLEAVKGHEYVIEAARIIREMNIDAQFIIAGTGTMDAELKTMVQEFHLDDTVLFAGFLNDVTGLMNILDIQVNASYGTEAASLSLLEGMGLGKPAVVSDYGGNPELITDGENGFVVPQKNAKALAMALAQLLQDEGKRAEMSKNCVELFNKKFTAKVMTKNMENFYTKLLGA